MSILTITPLYIALNVTIFVVLTMVVVHHRIENQVSRGDGGVEALGRAIRAHGNLTEYAPIALIMLAVLEINDLPDWQLHLLGTTFVIARLSHAYGIIKASFTPRSLGALTTLIMLIVMMGLMMLHTLG